MSTVLDYSILSDFSIIFIFLTVFLAGLGLMRYIDFFKMGSDSKLYAVLAFALSFIVVMSPTVVDIFTFAIPWLSIVLLIGFFLLFFAKMFNTDLDTAYLIGQGPVYGFLIAFVVIIFLFALSFSFGQDLLEEQPGFRDLDRIQGETVPRDTFVPEGQVPPAFEGQSSVSQQRAAQDQRDLGSNIVLTLFHPRILGMLFVILIATATILLIAR